MIAARRRFWFDPRFVIGIGLIVASVIGTALVIAAADDTVEVLAVRDVLMPGQRLESGDVVARRVAVDDAAELYLTPSDVADGLVITRVVGAGELLPRAAVGSADGVDSTTVVVPVDGLLASAVVPGAVVDVWATAADADGTQHPPAVVASSVTVARVVEESTLVVGAGTASVEVLVPRDAVAGILASIGEDAAVDVVPAALPVEH